ncbi:preprotein translocase subunit SecA [Streptomyces sp. NTH33]|uniref:SEC-C domain-containing protein n=1 Tax=Streptomyces sp. NTH33 TaxID=1735453 RepID=UPI000DA9D727|nr:SEC-C domain-containing protein [Streptomyces sp. NTH33]PZH12404.1 preprotein translocase subunit SecA [Streptomyces sp. NTH33]
MSSKSRNTGKKKAHKSKRVPAARAAAFRPATLAQSAEDCERLAEQHPEEREELLMEAADAWRDAGEPERALAVYERFLDQGEGGSERYDLVDAFRISALWDLQRQEEARAGAAAFRARHPRDAGAWMFVAECFEEADETATAAEWYTAGITHVLGAGTPVTADTVEEHPDSFDLESLVIGRHRVRRLLGAPHDDWDEVADELHEHRASPLPGRMRPLDEMHDPIRLRRLKEEGPEALEAEIRQLTEALEEERTAHTGTLRACVLFWPAEEFALLLQRWPKAAEAYGDDHAAHLRQVERTLREMSDEGAPHLAAGRATVAGLQAHAEADGGSPDAPATRSAYAAELARRGQATAWPPPRNGPCWCGSDRKYKKCCGNPAVN